MIVLFLLSNTNKNEHYLPTQAADCSKPKSTHYGTQFAFHVAAACQSPDRYMISGIDTSLNTRQWSLSRQLPVTVSSTAKVLPDFKHTETS